MLPRSAPRGTGDAAEQDRRQVLQVTRDHAVEELRRTLADRELLLAQNRSADGFNAALELQAGRLTSLGLLAPTAGRDTGGDTSNGGSSAVPYETCPVCGQHLTELDTAADDLAPS
jgi:hypothetical protein